MATSDGNRRLTLAALSGVAVAIAAIVAACSAGGPHTAAPTTEERRAPEAAASSPTPRDAGATDAGEQPLLYLGETEVESRFDGGVYPAGKPLRVTLEITPPRLSAFREIASRVTQKPASPTTFTFDLRGYPRAHDPVVPTYSKASFVVDYDEPAVKRAHDKAEAAHGKKPRTTDLEKFVDEYIEKKDLQRSFDLASQVAERKEGDCTEHAVLLTALARSFGYPARVVFGLVLMQGEGKVFAFGHAWVEYWNGHRWDPLDATPTRKAPDVRYIPTQVLMDEGPAFEAHIMQSMGAALLVKRASVAPL